MKKVNVDSLIGTVVALVVATFIGFAGSQGGGNLSRFPLVCSVCCARNPGAMAGIYPFNASGKLSITLI